MDWHYVGIILAALLGSGGLTALMNFVSGRRRRTAETAEINARTTQIRADVDLSYAELFRADLDAAKERIAQLERDQLTMHREIKALTMENIELRKKVAALEAENTRLHTLLQQDGD